MGLHIFSAVFPVFSGLGFSIFGLFRASVLCFGYFRVSGFFGLHIFKAEFLQYFRASDFQVRTFSSFSSIPGSSFGLFLIRQFWPLLFFPNFSEFLVVYYKCFICQMSLSHRKPLGKRFGTYGHFEKTINLFGR